ncbi:MAG TPA: phosphate--acyl-ACP acyltransferase [Bacteroidales bacterium]|nr:phosphate--acyl-ACP acyltransferase [Bacteroidales bacterium]
MLRIGIDIMGGDYAPEAAVKGAILAHNELKEKAKLVLIGNQDQIHSICEKSQFDPSLFEIVHTTEVIGMGEHPAKAFSQKPDSSIVVGYNMLMKKEIDGFASAGSTGAMLVGAMYTVKSIPGIIRPSITAAVPSGNEKPIILLDVGINPDCKPDVLYQYAILGSKYAEYVYKIDNPKVGLLNIGEEEEKGNLLTKATYQAMKGTRDFNFIGNIEGHDFFNDDKANVIVCDGFVGNVMLKEAEAFYMLVKKRNMTDEFFEKFNFENYGGTPILGINDVVIIGHGISNDIAIKNMVRHTFDVIEARLIDKIKEAFK